MSMRENTHTVHEYRTKGLNDNHTLTLEALSQTHTCVTDLGARQLSFPTAAPYLTETRFHTELFNLVFQRKKKDGGRVYEQKNNSERISIFGSWWVRRCFTVDTSPPPKTCHRRTVFRWSKCEFLQIKCVFYLKSALCCFKRTSDWHSSGYVQVLSLNAQTSLNVFIHFKLPYILNVEKIYTFFNDFKKKKENWALLSPSEIICTLRMPTHDAKKKKTNINLYIKMFLNTKAVEFIK